ncbi:4667_t:CDS:2 [Acaulospora morrowiae]|uniref:Palmitoyltransferase n=1 Tax=Acaulospora morrowiae TaxID=94023 RepID=A0A9N8ZVQ4_9GLOM|nr:4667_t:CDS:2 [Acaulospora morrowiae]
MEKSQKNIGDWASENKFIQFVVRVGNFLPVVFIVLLVMWSYYAFVVRLCILHLLNENSTQGVIYLVIYHPLLLMMMWCYFVATFTSPGYPDDPISSKSSRLLTLPGTTISSQHHPSEIHSSPEVKNTILLTKTGSSKQKPNIILDESGNPVSLGAIMVKQSGEKRYCQKCQYDKPDRTHHCRVCKRCILKMDQLNNCIGFRNQKSFYLFVIWGSLYSLYITIATIPPTVNYLQYSNEATIMSLDLNISFLILIGGVFALSLLGFSIYHTSLLLSNQTTLESLMTKQNFKMRETDEVTTGKLLNLYDIGKRQVHELIETMVMGPTWYLWFLPVGEPMGDGKTWLLNTARYSSLINSTDNLPGTPQTV